MMPRGMAQTRREFLERTAYAAGLVGMSAALPASTIVAEAAEAAARTSALPAPRNLPIDHFVVLMMENRSFDHYFAGWARRTARSSRATPTRPATRSRRATSRRSAAAAWSTRAAAIRTRATASPS
jgi:phospholipase C